MLVEPRETEPNVAGNLARFRRWVKRLAGRFSAPRRMEVTVQTERVLIIRRRRSMRVWCRQCGREVDGASFQEAGELTGAPLLVPPRNSAPGAWHVCLSENGKPFICLESVLKSM
jgi:hypothetical protein